MRKALLLAVAACILFGMMPLVSAVSMEINATPSVVHIGDTVMLRGSVSGLTTIAVYLFVNGPELDNRGVTLENLNYPAGRGLFTTAPVNLNDGTWEYEWDTSVILGTLQPGTYTVHVVSTPVDRLAQTEIEFLPSETPANEVPLDPMVTLAALITLSCAGTVLMRRLK
ncbi:MAG: hypothetical protein NTW33_03850 [Methanoregula sp.]|nr:hypothetical protein [Methanoregula sp.]